jgi:hypothetical protein
MLTKHLDITYSMVWSIAIANILGSRLCFLFSGQLAMVAFLGSMALIGLIPTVAVFIIAYVRLEGGEKYRHALIMAVMLTLICVVFDRSV